MVEKVRDKNGNFYFYTTDRTSPDCEWCERRCCVQKVTEFQPPEFYEADMVEHFLMSELN